MGQITTNTIKTRIKSITLFKPCLYILSKMLHYSLIALIYSIILTQESIPFSPISFIRLSSSIINSTIFIKVSILPFSVHRPKPLSSAICPISVLTSVAISTGILHSKYESRRDGKLGIVNRLSRNIKPTSHKLTNSSYFAFGNAVRRQAFWGKCVSNHNLTLIYSVPLPTITKYESSRFSFSSITFNKNLSLEVFPDYPHR